MKVRDFLKSLKDDDKGYRVWYEENWEKRTPPKRKLRIFLDQNIPQQLRDEIISSTKFKAFEEVKFSNREDKEIYSYCSRDKTLILTADDDFWNDTNFPLAQSPGVVIISPVAPRADIDSLIAFFASFDLIGGIRRFPDFARKMKFKISQSGYALKYISYEGKKEDLEIEY